MGRAPEMLIVPSNSTNAPSRRKQRLLEIHLPRTGRGKVDWPELYVQSQMISLRRHRRGAFVNAGLCHQTEVQVLLELCPSPGKWPSWEIHPPKRRFAMSYRPPVYRVQYRLVPARHLLHARKLQSQGRPCLQRSLLIPDDHLEVQHMHRRQPRANQYRQRSQ